MFRVKTFISIIVWTAVSLLFPSVHPVLAGVEIARLTPDRAEPSNVYAFSVAISGDAVVVGDMGFGSLASGRRTSSGA